MRWELVTFFVFYLHLLNFYFVFFRNAGHSIGSRSQFCLHDTIKHVHTSRLWCMGVLDSQVQEMHLFDTSIGYSKHRSSYIKSLYAPQPCTLPPQTAIRKNWDHAIAIFRTEKEKLRNVSTIYSPAYNACQSTCQKLQRTRNSASQKKKKSTMCKSSKSTRQQLLVQKYYLGLSGSRTRDLSHPKRESCH